MDRSDFEALRDIPGKVIKGDIRLVARRQTSPLLVVENLAIDNSDGVSLRLNINYNPEAGSKTFNVTAQGVGPICRLDVDGPKHRPAGRSHKHSLQGDRCPARNLAADVEDRSDSSGKPVSELFTIFCKMSNIVHEGEFYCPDS